MLGPDARWCSRLRTLPENPSFSGRDIHRRFLPKGILNVIQCRREDAAAVTGCLIAYKTIRKVEFPGSAAVGSIIGNFRQGS